MISNPNTGPEDVNTLATSLVGAVVTITAAVAVTHRGTHEFAALAGTGMTAWLESGHSLADPRENPNGLDNSTSWITQ